MEYNDLTDERYKKAWIELDRSDVSSDTCILFMELVQEHFENIKSKQRAVEAIERAKEEMKCIQIEHEDCTDDYDKSIQNETNRPLRVVGKLLNRVRCKK